MKNHKYADQILGHLDRQIIERRKKKLVETLRTLDNELVFTAGESLHVCGDGFTVFVPCVGHQGTRHRYTGVLLAGFPAGDEVADIDWQLWNAHSNVLVYGKTASGGHFAFVVDESALGDRCELSIRFGVSDTPTARIPTDFVESVAEALKAYRVANSDPDAFRPVPAPGTEWMDDRRSAVWRCPASRRGNQALAGHTESAAALGADTGDGGWQQVGETSENIGIQGNHVVVRCRADEVPYRVVRIVAKDGALLVGTCLLPLRTHGDQCSGACPASRIVGDRDPRELNWYAQAATGETLPWFPADEVAVLLERSDVMDSEELAKDVRRLCDRAREQEEINDD